MKAKLAKVPTLLVLAAIATAASAMDEDRDRRAPPAAFTLAVFPDAAGEIRMEQFGDGTVVMTERSSYGESKLQALDQLAKSKRIRLCPAQVFALLSSAPIPEVLFARCADQHKARADLEQLRSSAKVFRIFEGDFRQRPALCNGLGDDATQFRTIECTAEQIDLYGDSFYDSDNAFWCANSLRTSSDRIMSQMLNDEGEVASTRMLSCGGSTRFRFYKRDSTGDSWNLYRDYNISANEYFTLYSYDNDSYGDSDFRFRLTSDSGAAHRNTGYFIDD